MWTAKESNAKQSNAKQTESLAGQCCIAREQRKQKIVEKAFLHLTKSMLSPKLERHIECGLT